MQNTERRVFASRAREKLLSVGSPLKQKISIRAVDVNQFFIINNFNS